MRHKISGQGRKYAAPSMEAAFIGFAHFKLIPRFKSVGRVRSKKLVSLHDLESWKRRTRYELICKRNGIVAI